MKDKRVHIGRAINDISINGLEYLLDDDKEPMIFLNERTAKDFMFTQGYNEEMVKSLVYDPVKDTAIK